MVKIIYAVIARLTKSAEAISWRGRGLLRFDRNDIRRKVQNDMEMA
jgi:hypothetical protein